MGYAVPNLNYIEFAIVTVSSALHISSIRFVSIFVVGLFVLDMLPLQLISSSRILLLFKHFAWTLLNEDLWMKCFVVIFLSLRLVLKSWGKSNWPSHYYFKLLIVKHLFRIKSWMVFCLWKLTSLNRNWIVMPNIE